MLNLHWENKDVQLSGTLKVRTIVFILLVSHLKCALLRDCLENAKTFSILDKLRENISISEEKDYYGKLEEWFQHSREDINILLSQLEINKNLIEGLLWLLDTLYSIYVKQNISQWKSTHPKDRIEYFFLSSDEISFYYSINYIKGITNIETKLMCHFSRDKPILKKADEIFFSSVLTRLLVNDFTEIGDSVYSVGFPTKINEKINKYTSREKSNFYILFPSYPFNNQLPFFEKKELGKLIISFMSSYLKNNAVLLSQIQSIAVRKITSDAEYNNEVANFVENYFNEEVEAV